MFNKTRAAIDIGYHSAKIVEYKPIKNGVVINKVGRTEGLESKNMVNGILESTEAKQLTLLLSNSDSTLIKRRPEKNLQAQVQSLIKNGYSADYTKLGDDLYLLAHVEAAAVEKLVLPLIRARRNVVAVDTNASALFYLNNLYSEDFETKIFLDIGHLSSRILIIHQGEVIKYVKMDVGIPQIVRDIQDSIGTTFNRAMELVWRLGLDKDRLPVNANELLEDLNITEFEYGRSVQDRMNYFLSMLADALRSNVPFKAATSKMVLVGGGPLINGVENVLKENLKIEIETFSLVSSMTGDWKVINQTEQKIDSSYALAVGLALREVAK